MDSEILDWLIRYGYIFMFLLLLVEGPLVTATGAMAAALGYFNIFIVFILSFFGSFVPDITIYAAGGWGGQWVLGRYGERIGIPRSRRDLARLFINNNMGMWLFFIKTVPFISPVALASMGALRVPFRRFIWWDVIIVALNSLAFVLLGYYSGKGYDVLRQTTEYATLGLIGLFALFLAATFLYNRIARRFTGRMRRFTTEETQANQ